MLLIISLSIAGEMFEIYEGVNLMLFEDITAGNIDVINLVLMICSTVIIILVILSIIIKQYKSEKVLFGN